MTTLPLVTLREMDRIAAAGVVLGLVGGLLAFVPALERLLVGGPGWAGSLVLVLLSSVALGAIVMALNQEETRGGITAGVVGLVIAVVGPTAPGILALLGGVFVFASVQDEGPAVVEEDPHGKGSLHQP